MEDRILKIFYGFYEGLAKCRKTVFENPRLNNITLNQIHYLEAIQKLQPAMLNAIAKSMDVACSSATVAITKLIKAGYVTKKESDKDKRAIYVQLTEKGDEIVRAKNEIIKAYIDNVLSQLNDDERETFLGLSEKVIAMF